MLRAVIGFLRTWREQAPAKVRTSWGMIYRDDRFPLIHQANLGWVMTLPKEGPKTIIADLALAKVGLPDCIVNPELAVRAVAEEPIEDDFRFVMTATEKSSGHSPAVIDQMWGVWRERSRLVGMQPYVAYLNGTPVGTGSVWPRGVFAWIDDVATRPEFRMRGVGRTMIFEACKRAIEAR